MGIWEIGREKGLIWEIGREIDPVDPPVDPSPHQCFVTKLSVHGCRQCV